MKNYRTVWAKNYVDQRVSQRMSADNKKDFNKLITELYKEFQKEQRNREEAKAAIALVTNWCPFLAT